MLQKITTRATLGALFVAIVTGSAACGSSTGVEIPASSTGTGVGGTGGELGSGTGGTPATTTSSSTGAGGTGGTTSSSSTSSSMTGAGGTGGTPCVPSPEVCDGKDNDCNGEIDDGLPDVTCGVGECQVTVPSCMNGAPNTCVPLDPGVETCNDKDDDCNGLVDDGLPDITCGVGACQVTVPACANGAPNTCTPLPPAATESCNGIDDNCNGVVDEGCDCIDGKTQPCYSGPPATLNIGVCKGGTQTCVSGHWAACMGEVTPSPEVCDGKDNDCDGLADQGDPGAGASCGTGLAGICGLGTLHCTAGTLKCIQNQQPLPETCNGIDDNCDGKVDEATCDDSNSCTDDVCGGASGTCSHTPNDKNGCKGICQAGACIPTNELFYDGFESGLGNWSTGLYWTSSTTAYAGSQSLWGSWGNDFTLGCNLLSDAEMTRDVNLTFATSASLQFRSFASLGTADYIQVIASTNGGATWSVITNISASGTWVLQTVSLNAFLGKPAVRIGFRFFNKCGDNLGVDWKIDEVHITAMW